MKKITLTSILAISLICPAYADNENITDENKGCTSDTLTVDSGTAALEADWQANTVHVKYYKDGTEIPNIGSTYTQCTYDDTLTLPTAPSKDGYTFAGWTVRSAAPSNPQQTTITLSSLYDSGSINVFASKSLNPGVYCEGSSGYDDENDDYIWYGTDEQGEGACSNDSRFSGLNNGEWEVEMPNGNKVKGVATCSTTSGNNHSWQWGGNSADWSLASDALQAGQYSTDDSSGMQYCWCKATSGDTGSGYQSVASSSWVFYNDFVNAGDCASDCAVDCASDVRDHGDFRRAVFGVSQ